MMQKLRARALLLAGLLALAPASFSQTMEVYAGGGKIRNTPGANTPVVPEIVVIAPDGTVYVTDIARRGLVKFDPVTGLATLLPGTASTVPGEPDPPDFFLDANTLAFNPYGELFGTTDDRMFRFDLQDGSFQFEPNYYFPPTGADFQMAFDSNGNLYYYKKDNAIYSASNLLVRKPWGEIEHLKQVTDSGFRGDGGPLSEAWLTHFRGLAVDAAGNLYLSDANNNRVRKIHAGVDGITTESIITTVAGNGELYPYQEGAPATSTALQSPGALAVDSAGNLYINEQWGSRIRRVSAADGTITTYAGNGMIGFSGDGVPATSTSIDLISGTMAFDAADNLYLAEMGSNRVRRIDRATGLINTVVGNGTITFCSDVAPRRDACLGGPRGLTFDDAGNLYFSDSYNNRIRRIDAVTGELRTIAGSNSVMTEGADGGPATLASFGSDPGGIAFDPAGNLLIAATWANTLRRIDAVSGNISTVAGAHNLPGFSGDGGPASAARLNNVRDVAVDASGNIYLTDVGNRRVRRISAAGTITTIAGNGTSGFSGDGGPATAASLMGPEGIEVDAAGNILIQDMYRIRRVDAVSGIITTVAGNGNYFVTGTGGPATAAGLGSFTFNLDAAGNILIAAMGELRRVDRVTGIITRVSPEYGLTTPDGRNFPYPTGMAFAPDGTLYVGDSDENLIFRIDGVASGLPDTTPPVITAQVTGVAGIDDWYRSDVTITWTVRDNESAMYEMSGCNTRSITHDTNGGAYTCTASSSGGTSSQSVTVRRDTAAPVVTLREIYPAADSFGWHQNFVTVDYNATDNLSGVLPETANSLRITEEGAGLTGQVVVSDRAGNVTTFTSPPVNIDTSPPAIAISWQGPQGNNGWHTGDVTIDWQIWEPHSPIRSQTGCEDITLTTDTPGVTLSCSAVTAGGSLSSSRTFKRDATPPSLVFGPPSPAPNANGWHTGNVTFPFTSADGTSGVASVSSPGGSVAITGEGAGLTATVSVTDAAGNTASFTTPPVNIDRSTVAVIPVVTGTLGNEGWYRSDIGVSWNITGNVVSSTGCGATTVTTDTAGVTFTCSVTGSSNSASQSVTVKRDATPPVLTWRAGTPAANAAGWNRANVSFPYNTPTDARSGVASVSAASPVVVSSEGTGVTASVTVTDRAGNSAVFTTTPRNIDKTAPTVTIVTPASNAVVGLYATAFANYSCVDAVSGVTTCSGTQPNGAQLNTRSMNGWYTFRVTGTDIAGNSFQRSHNWSTAGSFLFEGYLAPMQNDPTFNLVTAGSRVPMRFKLPDRLGGYVSDPGVMDSFTVDTERCLSNVVPFNDVAVGGAGLSFDAATSTYTYNWDTNAAWAGTCRNVKLRLIDGSRHTLMFKFQ